MLTPMPADFWERVVREVACMIMARETSSNGITVPSTQKIWRTPPDLVTTFEKETA